MIRTSKIPFVQSRPSLSLLISSFAVVAIALAVGFTSLSIGLDMMPLPTTFIPWLALILFGYALSVQLIKSVYVKRYGQWL